MPRFADLAPKDISLAHPIALDDDSQICPATGKKNAPIEVQTPALKLRLFEKGVAELADAPPEFYAWLGDVDEALTRKLANNSHKWLDREISEEEMREIVMPVVRVSSSSASAPRLSARVELSHDASAWSGPVAELVEMPNAFAPGKELRAQLIIALEGASISARNIKAKWLVKSARIVEEKAPPINPEPKRKPVFAE
jgi:hypothetical protein